MYHPALTYDLTPTLQVPAHTVDRALFRAIARGRGGVQGVRRLRSGQFSKRALLLMAVHRHARGATGSDARDASVLAWFDAAYRRLVAWQRTDPQRWEQVLMCPQFDAWAAGCLVDLASGRCDSLTGLADLCGDAVGERPATDPITGHTLTLSSEGRDWTVTIQDSGAHRDLFGHRPTAPLRRHELDAWTTALTDAWSILVRRHPWHAEAVQVGVVTVVPLLPAADGSPVSSAARRAYGAVAASLPARPALLAMTLVHEFLHVQLGALMDLVPLHRPDSGARFHAPWRPDPRPAGALLQGLYAHMGVADFLRHEHLAGPSAELRLDREAARWRTHAADAARALLASEELTPAGREFTGEVLAVLESGGI